MTPDRFRAFFPALADRVWLDTPASPPGPLPVTAALTEAITAWQDGRLDAAHWEQAAPAARLDFARYLGVPASDVALMGTSGSPVVGVMPGAGDLSPVAAGR